jgi:hypothetical protein
MFVNVLKVTILIINKEICRKGSIYFGIFQRNYII